MDKLKNAWAAIDGSLPRMWKEWLVTLLVVAVIYHFFIGGAERASVLLAKVPLLTLGGLLGYHGDRAIFPYARPSDMKEAINLESQGPMSGERYAAHVSAFNAACIRRAIIVAACVLGAALAA